MVGPRDERSDDVVTRALAVGLPRDALEEQQALAALERNLLGDTAENRPVQLSRYVLLEQLGAGGVGVVYSAFDPELDRKVAIKLLRGSAFAGGSAADGQARLVREAQAMARLAHPNVIAVHDVGTYGLGELGWAPDAEGASEEGVFVVMELVEGLSLRQWIRLRRRTWQEVLRVFLPAGRGLAAAHAVGLVHRDFKPANVLVGNDGRVRVLDFGLARAVGEAAEPEPRVPRAQLTPSSNRGIDAPLTETGTVMGTPPYMAPEQHRGEVAGESADQFAYCVALYEGLIGKRPFVGTSLRALQAAKEEGAAERPEEREIPGWVMRVVRRGLSPDPRDRYPSMQALLSELEMDPRARRRRAVLATGLVALLLAGIGSGYVWWSNQPGVCDGQELLLAGVWDDDARARTRDAFAATGKPYATEVARSVERIVDDYARQWVEARAAVCRATRVDGTESAAVMADRNACLDRRLDEVEQTVRLFVAADGQVVEHAVAAASALPTLEPCLPGAGSPRGMAQLDPELARSLDRELSRLRSLASSGKLKEIPGLAEPLLARVRELGDSEREARVLVQRGVAERSIGEREKARDTMYEALLAAERAGATDLGTRIMIHQINMLAGLREFDAAEKIVSHAAARLAHRGLDDALDANLQYEIGTLRHEQGRYEEAVEAHRRALEINERILPAGHPTIAAGLNAVGLVLYTQGDYTRAQEYFESSLEMRRAVNGPRHPEVASVLNNLGIAATATGDLEGALTYHLEALSIRRESTSENNLMIVSSLSNVGNIHHAAGRYAEALEYQEQAAALARKIHGGPHPSLAMALGNTGTALLELGRTDEALAAQEEAARVYAETTDPGHPDHGYPAINIAEILTKQGKFDQAVARAREAAVLWEKVFGRVHPLSAEAHTVEGLALLGEGETQEAIAVLERALEVRRQLEGAPSGVARTAFALARAVKASDPKRARVLATEARDIYRQLGVDAEREKVERWLEE